MKFTSEKATFFQCGFNFYIGDIDDESTILFKEDYIIIGNVSTLKNVFAMGELIVVGDIECKSIYVSKDFFCLGNIETELVEVEGKTKVLSKEDFKNELSLNIVDKIIEKRNDVKELNSEIFKNIEIENNQDDIYKTEVIGNNVSLTTSELINKNEKEVFYDEQSKLQDNSELYEKYITKKGDVVLGKVINIKGDNYIVKVDDIECKLFKDRDKKFEIGDEVVAYIQTIKYENGNLEIRLAENDRSYIIKIIKKEMEKNKYNFEKVFIKEIYKVDKYKCIVYIYSDQHTQKTLDIIEGQLKKYTNGREIKLCDYNEKNKIEKDIEIEINKNLDGLLSSQCNITKKMKSIHNYYIGDRIYHKKFGEGKILDILDKDVARIEFYGVFKNLDLTYLIYNNLVSK